MLLSVTGQDWGFSRLYTCCPYIFFHIQPGLWNSDEVLLTVWVLCAAVALPTKEVPPEPSV